MNLLRAYFYSLLFILIFLGCSEDGAGPDTTAPTLSNSTITLSNGTPATTVIDVSWTAATDNVTLQSAIKYKVVYSLSNNLTTIADAEANGTVALDYTENTTSLSVSGLSALSTYYVAVIAKDTAGNKAIYTSTSHTTTCFIGETLILLADGSSKRIDQIQEGDEVLSFNVDGSLTTSVVGAVLKHQTSNYLNVTTETGSVGVTANHPFYVGESELALNDYPGFRPIGDLKVGDFVYVFGDKTQPVKTQIVNIDLIERDVPVYNLHISRGPSTFFANGYVVHNY